MNEAGHLGSHPGSLRAALQLAPALVLGALLLALATGAGKEPRALTVGQ